MSMINLILPDQLQELHASAILLSVPDREVAGRTMVARLRRRRAGCVRSSDAPARGRRLPRSGTFRRAIGGAWQAAIRRGINTSTSSGILPPATVLVTRRVGQAEAQSLFAAIWTLSVKLSWSSPWSSICAGRR